MSHPTREFDFFTQERINSEYNSIQGLQNPISTVNREIFTPVFNPASCCTVNENGLVTAPLTISYNGNVTVFHVGQAEAENIMRLASEASARARILTQLRGGLPLSRKMSLLRFLKKRKERSFDVTVKHANVDQNYDVASTQQEVPPGQQSEENMDIALDVTQQKGTTSFAHHSSLPPPPTAEDSSCLIDVSIPCAIAEQRTPLLLPQQVQSVQTTEKNAFNNKK